MAKVAEQLNTKQKEQEFARSFTWSETDEPHATRRKLILAKYPQIARLFGPEPKTFPIVLSIVAFQFYVAYLLNDASWGLIFVLAYIVGGTANHSLQLAMHELSHNLCFHAPWKNKLLAIVCNLPTGVPSAISFQRYHMEHHQNQGVDQIDVDIPSQWEVDYFTNTAMKVLWLILQPFFYALRPLISKPKPRTNWEHFNGACVLAVNVAVVYFMGAKSLVYMIAGSLLGLGLHPSAGHFIAEHYEFIKGQETYSYYGPFNFTNWNVGYHNEHHDFPKVPWSRLAQVKAMAPEFYDTLPSYDSYLYVMWKYITDPTVGPWSRVKRKARVINKSPAKKKSKKSKKQE